MCVAVLAVCGYFGVRIWNKVHAQNEVQEFIVPNLVNRKYEDAKAEYANHNVEIIAEKHEYNPDIEKGHIISQVQEANTVITTGKIYVVVSKGAKMVKVSDVEGKDVKVATYELETTLGFKVQVEEEVNEEVAAGIVISQDIEANTEQPYGSTIKLVVSKGDGKENVVMPTVVGKTEAEAKKELEGLKLTVEVGYDEDKTKTNGVVLAQSYPKNQSLKEGDLVKITVNKLLITKNVTIDVVELLGGKTLEEDEKVKIKVVGSIDGGAENTYFPEKEFGSEDKKATFAINGYKTAVMNVFLDGKLAKQLTIDFNK